MLIFAFLFLFVYYLINLARNNNQTKEVNSTPLTSKTIIVDCGHGLPDEGGYFIEVYGM